MRGSLLMKPGRIPHVSGSRLTLDGGIAQGGGAIRLRSARRLPKRAKSVSLKTLGFVAKIVSARKQQVFDVPQRQRTPDVPHDYEADHFG